MQVWELNINGESFCWKLFIEVFDNKISTMKTEINQEIIQEYASSYPQLNGLALHENWEHS